MLNFDIYAIATEKDERYCNDDEWFLSFEEAMANRFKYANWFRQKGNVWIRRYAGKPYKIESWLVNEKGEIVDHFGGARKNN